MPAYTLRHYSPQVRRAFGNLLRDRRHQRGWKQKVVATRMGFDPKMPSRYEAGAVPVDAHLPAVAAAYQLPLATLQQVLGLPTAATPDNSSSTVDTRLDAARPLVEQLSPERWEAWLAIGRTLLDLE